MIDKNSPIFKEFLIESFEGLSGISDDLTRFEKQKEDKELLNSIYRKVHTLKGSASFLGLEKLKEITHSAENVLDQIREGNIEVEGEVIDIFLECFDCCLELLKNLETEGVELSRDYGSLILKINGLVPGRKVALHLAELSIDGEAPLDTLKFKKNTEDTQKKKDENLSSTKKYKDLSEENLSEHKTVVKDYPPPINDKKIDREKGIDQKLDIQDTHLMQKSTPGIEDSVVRVNVKLLDKIMNIIGELVLNRNQISQYASKDDSGELNRLAHELNVITTELQADIMTTRMQPVGSVLSKFERIVRDISKSQNKKIELIITGKDTELDKTLLEAIKDPLTHLIRNSVDHGIETPADRIAKGKREEGTIQIKSYHEGGQVIIEIKDDGNGIDPEKILRKAVLKNLVAENMATKLSEKQIMNLIFLPGFSTAEAVTNISGRGVGMDVVKSNIDKIGGSVDVSSSVGEGSSFRLKIPLTLAIVPALIIQSSNDFFAIPQINLVELVRFDIADSADKIEKIKESEFFRLRGDLIPIYRLSKILKEELVTKNQDVNIVVLNAEGRIYGLIVQNVLDTEEIVVKPLSKRLKDLNLFGGATLKGDGKVALIIDAIGFLNYVDVGKSPRTDNIGLSQVMERKIYKDADEILLIRLEDNKTYGIPLLIVHRLEELRYSKIEWSGNLPLVRYRGMGMPLINIEEMINLKQNVIFEKTRPSNQEDFLYSCVVVKMHGQYVGVVVKEILDISENIEDLDGSTINQEGLLGTAFINGTIVTLLDIHGIIKKSNISFKVKSKSVKGRVLIIDDSPLHQKILSESLETLGCEVKCVGNGREGIEIFEAGEKFDLIISDLEMPEMDGFQFIKAFKSKFSSMSAVPIIAVSSNLEVRKKSEESGQLFDYSFDKLKNEALLAKVKLILGEIKDE